jgi:hypothetical protein
VRSAAAITGSRQLDRALFLMLASVALVGCLRLRVYFRVTVAEVHATRIDADGSRHEIEVPANFVRMLAATYSTTVFMHGLASRMEAFSHREAPAARIEWTVRYSYDSNRLDQVRVFMFPEAHR